MRRIKHISKKIVKQGTWTDLTTRTGWIPAKYGEVTVEGNFHQWSQGMSGDEQWAEAIIELDDGIIITPIATECQFIK